MESLIVLLALYLFAILIVFPIWMFTKTRGLDERQDLMAQKLLELEAEVKKLRAGAITPPPAPVAKVATVPPPVVASPPVSPVVIPPAPVVVAPPAPVAPVPVVADEPPPGLVAKLQDAFRRTDGDLKAMTLALIDADEAWKAPPTKIRSPYEFLVATGRVLARIPEDPGRYLGGLNTLGQPLWSPSGPNGFADTNAAWAAPEGIKLRLDISAQVASRIADSVDPRDLLEAVAADAASAETRRTVERAESRQQALALLLMSPEFQRR